MIDLMERADPAAAAQVDRGQLRDRVDEKLGLSTSLAPFKGRLFAPWLVFTTAMGLVLVIAIPSLLRSEGPSVFAPEYDGLLNFPGIEEVIPIGAGVSTMGVDGDTIWVMSALSNELKRIDAATGEVEATYQIDAYVEGAIPGGGYVWLHSYDNDGEILRFNPNTGTVDMAIPIPGPPELTAAWFGDRLWVSNQGDMFTITVEGRLAPAGTGSLEGEGLGYLWLSDSAGSLVRLSEDGTRGDVVIPRDADTSLFDGEGNVVGPASSFVLTDAGGYLWQITGDEVATRTTLTRIDPSNGETVIVAGSSGLHGMVEHDGYLWVISLTDHLLFRIDPETRDTRRFPLPGKTGGIVVADGSLWVDLFHPGAVVRLDTEALLIEAGELFVDRRSWNSLERPEESHRLMCTGPAEDATPTIILESWQWVGLGSWSVVQAMLSETNVVCVHGYLREAGQSPSQRARDLRASLDNAAVEGPYVLVTAGDGVHTTRLFADGRDDVVGVVMVDPVPVGWDQFIASVVVAAGEDPNGIGNSAELDPGVSAGLDDYESNPVVVIGQDPSAMFLSDESIALFGEGAEVANAFWQDGLAFYAGLSTDSRSVVADGTGMHMIVWDRPDLVVEEVLGLMENFQG